MNTYSINEFFLVYIKWHYSRGFNEFIDIARNFFFFLLHFFSLKLLLKTLFSPWKRMSEPYEKGLHIESVLSTLLVNIIMRVVGVISRLVIIFIALISLVIFILFALLASIVWLLMPFVLLAFIASAFFLIYASYDF